MTITNNVGLYLHIPFCLKKCRYCDFLSFPCSDEEALTEYTEALVREIRIKASEWPYRMIDSVYIGGGTPSILSEKNVARIMDQVNKNFVLSDDPEITIECNPATASEEKLQAFREMGINRISIGIQSWDNSVLRLMGRAHDKNDSFTAIRNAKKAGFDNINLDLMFGIPGQTMKMWRDSIRQCIFLRPQHISLYSLQLEEGTQFYKMVYEDHILSEPSEMTDRKMYHDAIIMLEDAGYNLYEISNAALPGYESFHNSKYWSYDDYLGLGLGASSFIGGVRYKNCTNMLEYLDYIKKGQAPVNVDDIEKYSKRDEMGIYVFTGLRKSEGIDIKEFEKIFGTKFFSVYDPSLINVYFGYLDFDGCRLKLTEEGRDIANRIMSEFV
ncbi:MAG: radical SAM family heme chaperone HemW [Firmicutes bacterium]|nr:radical SAM family heme chaperone HemW [Bacillota bacterium]